MKEPLENREWYNYPGDPWPGITGTSDQPSKIARVIEDGSTQIWQYQRNALSYVTRAVDPLGRETLTDYAANGIDVVQIRQKNGGAYDTIASFTWNSQHRPLSSTDAVGETTTYTWNARGQLLSTTNPLNQTTTFNKTVIRSDPSHRLQRAKDPAPLKVKEVEVEGRRYVVCLNEEERRKDAHDRACIVEALREQLRRGDKSLIGNKGYRRFLKIEGGGHFLIDENQVALEERYDGLFVLRTDTDHDAETIARVYKTLWMVEDTFRTAKSILETRPIFHKCDETIRGHVFCSFLALVLKRELEIRMEQNNQHMLHHSRFVSKKDF